MLPVKELLKQNADLPYREFHKKLVPGVENFIGVRMPIMKKIAKEIVKDDPLAFLEEKSFAFYEEKMLYGLVIGQVKLPFPQIEAYILDFVPRIDNWAICDCFCSGLKITVKNKEEMLKIIEHFSNSTREFELRFAIVMLMCYYMEPNYMDQIFELFNRISHEGYYVKMGIAWAVSTAFVKERERTLPFIGQNNLDKWTHNKGIQKIRESYRVSAADKSMLMNMKK